MAYNFNPRDNFIRQYRVNDYYNIGFMKRDMIPYGNQKQNIKFRQQCGQQQRQYRQCLIKTQFDRKQCDSFVKSIIQCQKDKNMYKYDQKLLILKNGLVQLKKKKKQLQKQKKQSINSKMNKVS